MKNLDGLRKAYFGSKRQLKDAKADGARFRAKWRALGFDPPPSREEYQALIAYLEAMNEVQREIIALLESGIEELKNA